MSKTAIYTGKLFTLKKTNRINWATKPNKRAYGESPDYRSGTLKKEEIINQAMILNESTKKVQVYLGEKVGYVWISKFYLGDEIITNGNKDVCELLDKSIKQIATILNKNVTRPNSEKAVMCEVLKNLRTVRTSLE